MNAKFSRTHCTTLFQCKRTQNTAPYISDAHWMVRVYVYFILKNGPAWHLTFLFVIRPGLLDMLLSSSNSIRSSLSRASAQITAGDNKTIRNRLSHSRWEFSRCTSRRAALIRIRSVLSSTLDIRNNFSVMHHQVIVGAYLPGGWLRFLFQSSTLLKKSQYGPVRPWRLIEFSVPFF